MPIALCFNHLVSAITRQSRNENAVGERMFAWIKKRDIDLIEIPTRDDIAGKPHYYGSAAEQEFSTVPCALIVAPYPSS